MACQKYGTYRNFGKSTLFGQNDLFEGVRVTKNEQKLSETLTRDIPTTMIVRNNYFEGNSSGNGENLYSHGYDGDIDWSWY